MKQGQKQNIKTDKAYFLTLPRSAGYALTYTQAPLVL